MHALTYPFTDSTAGFLFCHRLCAENHDEEPELKVVLPVEDAAAQELKTAILARGKQVWLLL